MGGPVTTRAEQEPQPEFGGRAGDYETDEQVAAWERHRALMGRVMTKHAATFRALALSEQLDREPYECERL